ncbi:MAG: biotin/lipoyl-binding protein [Myxococcales bacterium]|nr:biotin/lipoyl-binding protein [Myxococcales bacterium]
MHYYVSVTPGREISVEVATRSDGSLEVHADGRAYDVDVVEAEPALTVRVDASIFDLWPDGVGARDASHGDAVSYVAGTRRIKATLETERARIGARASRSGGVTGGLVIAPMPGRIVKVLVREGDPVEEGAAVIVVEAMKMENELTAVAPGIVRKLHVVAGQTVDAGTVLLELDPPLG